MVDSSDDIIEFIDLSDSFILADHQASANVMIELDTDDSIILDSDNSMVVLTHSNSSRTSTASTESQSRRLKKDKGCTPSANIKQKQEAKLESRKIKNEAICDGLEHRVGGCPICFEAFGKNPLASTICGHIYCMKCLQQYLSFDQRCPICRKNLREESSYHPLYLIYK